MKYSFTGVNGFISGVTCHADNNKACVELGYEPRPLEEGLRETLQALQKNGAL